jgi:hypothetical protein
VHWQKSGQCWVVVAGLAYVGTFLDEKEAALAHDEKAIELCAWLGSPRIIIT